MISENKIKGQRFGLKRAACHRIQYIARRARVPLLVACQPENDVLTMSISGWSSETLSEASDAGIMLLQQRGWPPEGQRPYGSHRLCVIQALRAGRYLDTARTLQRLNPIKTGCDQACHFCVDRLLDRASGCDGVVLVVSVTAARELEQRGVVQYVRTSV